MLWIRFNALHPCGKWHDVYFTVNGRTIVLYQNEED